MKEQRLYAVRQHDRYLETDPELATLMYSTHGPEGPWHDIATGHPDNIWELLELTYLREELHRLRNICEKHNIDWYTTDGDD